MFIFVKTILGGGGIFINTDHIVTIGPTFSDYPIPEEEKIIFCLEMSSGEKILINKEQADLFFSKIKVY